MKEFEVTITETLEKKITVEALSKGEAEQAVRDMWNDADIILDADDFIDVSFNTDDGKELSAVNESKKLDVLLVEPGQYVARIEQRRGAGGDDVVVAVALHQLVQRPGGLLGAEELRGVHPVDVVVAAVVQALPDGDRLLFAEAGQRSAGRGQNGRAGRACWSCRCRAGLEWLA